MNESEIKNKLPKITGSVIIVLFCLFLIVYAIKIYFDTYQSNYDIIKATIKGVKCERSVIANVRVEYHCILNVDYKYRAYPINSDLITQGSTIYLVGDQIDISVNKQNPIEITLPNVSNKVTAIIIILFSIAVLGMVFAYNYIDIV